MIEEPMPAPARAALQAAIAGFGEAPRSVLWDEAATTTSSPRPWLDPALDAESRYVHLWAAAAHGIAVDPADMYAVRADLDHAEKLLWLTAFTSGAAPNPTLGLSYLAKARGVDIADLKNEPVTQLILRAAGGLR